MLDVEVVEVLDHQGDQLVEVEVAAGEGIVLGRELEVDERRRAVRVVRAVLGAPLEALLERPDTVEPGAVRVGVVDRAAGLVPELDDRGQRGVERVGLHEVREAAGIVDEVGQPRAGEAVGLLLHDDRRLVDADLELRHVAPLVGEHDGRCDGAEPLAELRDELLVVPHHGDALRARRREGVALDVAVADLLPVAGRVLGVFRAGDDPRVGDHLVGLAVDRRHRPVPEVLHIGGHVAEVVLVQGRDGRLRRLRRGGGDVVDLVAAAGDLVLVDAAGGDEHCRDEQGSDDRRAGSERSHQAKLVRQTPGQARSDPTTFRAMDERLRSASGASTAAEPDAEGRPAKRVAV